MDLNCKFKAVLLVFHRFPDPCQGIMRHQHTECAPLLSVDGTGVEAGFEDSFLRFMIEYGYLCGKRVTVALGSFHDNFRLIIVRQLSQSKEKN